VNVEPLHLMNAQDQASQYQRHIEEAMASADSGEMKQHIQEAMPFGQNVLDSLEEALNMTEDPDRADRIEESMHHMSASMDQGDQALEASEDEMEDFVAEMRKQAQQSMTFLAEAMGAVP